MKIQEPLTKENCFNELMAKYPKALKIFCDWIAEYKQAVNWGSMFAANENTMQLHSSKYKFDEIPFAMQIGIIMEFILNAPEAYGDADASPEEDCIMMIFFMNNPDGPDAGDMRNAIKAELEKWCKWKEELITARN